MVKLKLLSGNDIAIDPSDVTRVANNDEGKVLLQYRDGRTEYVQGTFDEVFDLLYGQS